jgi:hypothetical protein
MSMWFLRDWFLAAGMILPTAIRLPVFVTRARIIAPQHGIPPSSVLRLPADRQPTVST